MTDGWRDSCLLEGILELLDHDLRCWLEAIAHNPFSGIIGDKVHMCELAFEEFRELMGKFWTIRHSGDHDILIEYPLIRLRDIAVETRHENIDRIGSLHGHDPLTSLVVRCVEWDGERNLWEVIPEAVNAWDDPTGRDRDTTIREVELFLVTRDTDGFRDIIIVQHGLTHAHIDDITDFFILFREEKICYHDLIDNLREFEIANESELSSRTEATRHRTPCLTGDAEGIASWEVTHDHCLDHLVIMSLEEEFRRLSILTRHFWMDTYGDISTILFQEFSYLFRKSLDRIELSDQVLINRILYLSISESLVSMRLEECDNLFFIVNGEHKKFIC